MRNQWCLLVVVFGILGFHEPLLGRKKAKRVDAPIASEQPSVQQERVTDFSEHDQIKEKAYNIRVLLSEQPSDVDSVSWCWELKSSAGFFLADSVTGSNRMKSAQVQLRICAKEGFFYINDKKVQQKEFLLKAQDGHILFQDRAYGGSFFLVIHEKFNRCYLINVVDLEEYVCSVLKSEGWPGWPLEMNKVLAVTSRTYALAMMQGARENKRIYDLKNTNVHQTYHGAHAQQILKKAVDATKGLFVGYQGNPIVAMFDICCGGVVPAHIEGFDFGRAPYLARDYACTYCRDCSSYHWSFSLGKSDLIAHLQKDYPQLTTLREFKITKKDKAGLVCEARAKGVRTTLALTGRKLYSLFKEIKSYCFGVQRKGSAIIFSGRGFGHHIGLCQWGARAMVRDGWDYRNILTYYYPGTKLMKLG